MRISYKRKPTDRVERSLLFVPLDTGVFNPEVSIATFAPVSHRLSVKKLDSEVEAAHLTVFLEVPDQLVMQGIWIILLQRTRRIVRRGHSRMLNNINRTVTKRHGAPIAKLRIRLNF